jgi:hypothetical protein
MQSEIYSKAEHQKIWKREARHVRQRLEADCKARFAEVQFELAEESARIPINVDRVEELIAEARHLYDNGVDEVEVFIEASRIAMEKGMMIAFRRAFGLTAVDV